MKALSRLIIVVLLSLAFAACDDTTTPSTTPETPETTPETNPDPTPDPGDPKSNPSPSIDDKDLAILIGFLENKEAQKDQDIGEFIKIKYLGEGKISEEEPVLDPKFEDDGTDIEDIEEDKTNEDFNSLSFIAFNSGTGHQYEIILEAPLLAAAQAKQEESGGNLSSESVKDPKEIEESNAQLNTQNVTDGVDTRILRTNTTIYPWKTISAVTFNNNLNLNCSSTLVGPKLLITAAHCLSDNGSSTWYPITSVTPGLDRGNRPFGRSTGPFIFISPTNWRTSSECINNRAACRRWDYGFIVTPESLGNIVGYMGYAALNSSTLRQQSHYNRGYPSCAAIDPDGDNPANCQVAGFYGDVNTCDIGRFSYRGSDGWRDRLRHSCDTSEGHSGSSLYTYLSFSSGAFGPAVTSVHTSGFSNSHLGNGARRLGPSEVSATSFYRLLFP